MFYKIKNGSISYGLNNILPCINFSVNENERIGLVGRNGCGKTSLLKAIVQEVSMEEGIDDSDFEVSSSNGLKIGYLSQTIFEDDSITLYEHLLGLYKDILDLNVKLEEANKIMEEDPSEINIKSYYSIYEKFESEGGFLLQSNIKRIVCGLGFSLIDLNKPLSSFSGGEKTKICLSELLIKKLDILILDEPTNNLDIKAISFLEKTLSSYKSSLVIVSHDRMFLDKVCNVIYEIEWGKLTRYKGNYSAFIKQKEERYLKDIKDASFIKKEMDRLDYLIKKNINHPTKASFAKSLRKKLEKMEYIEPLKFDKKAYLPSLTPKRKEGEEVLICSKLSIGYTNPLQDITLNLRRGMKVGIIGNNGIGKSTFVKTIMNLIPSLNGEYRWGLNVDIGYFDQCLKNAYSNSTLLNDFSRQYVDMTINEIRTYLGSFGFKNDAVFKKLNELSGGEKVRYILSLLFKSKPNVLVLDEPTNHVDIIGKTSFEEVIKDFKGTVLLISHDRYLINRVCDHLLIFEDDKVSFFDGNYQEYSSYLEKKNVEINIVKTKTKNIDDKKTNRRNNLIIEKEKEITLLENDINKIKNKINNEENYLVLKDLEKDLNNLEEKLNRLMDEWTELSWN